MGTLIGLKTIAAAHSQCLGWVKTRTPRQRSHVSFRQLRTNHRMSAVLQCTSRPVACYILTDNRLLIEHLPQFRRCGVPFCFEVRFRMSRPIDADRLQEEIRSATFKQPLRFWRPWGTAKDEGWLAIESCGYATFAEACENGVRVQDALLMGAAKQQVGVEFIGRGAVSSVAVFSQGRHELVDPGAPLPVPLKAQELIGMVTAAVGNAWALTANQRVAAELLNDSLFAMSPEARFLLRVSSVEALCPQSDQTEAFRDLVARVRASIPAEASNQDQNQLKEALERVAKRQSVRSAYMSKIRRLLGDEKAKRFDVLYERRSDFLHDGKGRGTLGEGANAASEICLALLLADIARSVAGLVR
jgi:hypothetical protein